MRALSRHLNRLWLPVVLIGLGTACGPQGPTSEEPADNGPPLGSYGALFEGAPDNSTLPNEMKADVVYPEQFADLVALQSPVRSQGSRGVCSIFSTTALMEHLYIKAGMDDPDFSEQYLQWSVKVQEGAFRTSGGSNAASNLRAINNYGIPAEEAWPYQSFKWTSSNDEECDGEDPMPTRCYTNGDPPESAKQAKMYFLPRGRYMNTNSIKNQLYVKKQGVVVGLDFFYQSWNHRRSTLPTNRDNWRDGYVLYPNSEDVKESHEHRAGHSILLVGWDDNLEVPKRDKDGEVVVDDSGEPVMEKGFYLFKNSWGTGSFGSDNPHGDGYGWISMAYVERYGSARVSDVPELEEPKPEGNEQELTGSVAHGEQAHHQVEVGAEAKNIQVVMTGNNDADLYTQFGTEPSMSSYDCRPYESGSDETCTHESAGDAVLHIMVYGWASGTTDYTIKVTWE